MTKVHLLAALCALALATTTRAADKPSPAAKKDLDALQGHWAATSAEVDGKPMDAERLKLVFLRVTGDQYAWQINDLGQELGTLRLTPDQKPKGLDLVGTRGNNEGKTVPAIYALDGDTLKVCYDLVNPKRPTAFKAPAGSFLFYVTYQRQPKPDDAVPFGTGLRRPWRTVRTHVRTVVSETSQRVGSSSRGAQRRGISGRECSHRDTEGTEACPACHAPLRETKKCRSGDEKKSLCPFGPRRRAGGRGRLRTLCVSVAQSFSGPWPGRRQPG